MADLKEMQAQSAERIVSQFFAVQKELRNRVADDDVDMIAATLTAGLVSSDEGIKACGIISKKPTPLTPYRT
jgi:predicted DNA-binding protein (UPF0278 family)